MPAGGALEVECSRLLRAFAAKQSGLEQYAIVQFANALEVVPRTIAENSGEHIPSDDCSAAELPCQTFCPVLQRSHVQACCSAWCGLSILFLTKHNGHVSHHVRC